MVSEGNVSEDARQHFKTQRNRWQQKAADEFATLEELLDTPAGKDALTPELRLQVPFFAAKCLRDAGQPAKAREDLRETHRTPCGEIRTNRGLVVPCRAMTC